MKSIIYFFIFFLSTHTLTQRMHFVIACHGNMDLTPHLSLSNFKRFYKDDIVGSLYESNVKNMRNNPFFFLHNPMQSLGLQPINITLKKNDTAGLFAHIHHLLSKKKNTAYRYYTFGWSGLQSPKARLAEAQSLYEQLKKEVMMHINKGYDPQITLIGYSHGGNVALNIAAYFNKDDIWRINNLVLLGVPIVPESSKYALNTVFKKIYNFYSLADRVQPLDCFGQNRIFSSRCLNNSSSSSKIYNIQLRIKRSNSSTAVYHALQRAIKKNDPSHVEWWSFGWTAGYRSLFALYPLPVSVITPVFINAIDTLCLSSSHLVVDLHVYKNIFYIYDGYSTQINHFIDPYLFNLFKKQADYVRPAHYSKSLFKQQVRAVMCTDPRCHEGVAR